MGHEFQHADGPTWCVHCGTFDVYCRPGEECPDRTAAAPRYDFRDPDRYARQFAAMFGEVRPCPH